MPAFPNLDSGSENCAPMGPATRKSSFAMSAWPSSARYLCHFRPVTADP